MAEDNTENRARVRVRAASAAVPRPFGMPLPLRWPEIGLAGALGRALAREVEERRLFPWLPVCFAAGILLFFQADGEPALWAPLGACGLSCALAVAFRARFVPMTVLIGLAAAFAGFAAGVIRTRSVAAPVLTRTVIGPVAGFIEAVEERPQGARLTLSITALDRAPAAERPRRIRVTIRSAKGLSPGLHVAGQARLLPPPQPAWPGGYDFARDASFREIGAVGSILGTVAPTEPPGPPGWRLGIAAAVDQARNVLTQRIANAIGGQAGAVAAALITGKRGLSTRRRTTCSAVPGSTTSSRSRGFTWCSPRERSSGSRGRSSPSGPPRPCSGP